MAPHTHHDGDQPIASTAPSHPLHPLLPPAASNIPASPSIRPTFASSNNSNSNTSNDCRNDESLPKTLSPIQLVALSNLKLNSDMFSNRSLSIHRRILVKNLLTLLYQLDPPMDWTQMQLEMQRMEYGGDHAGDDQGSMLLGEEEQNGWMERTLHAAGLNESDDAHDSPQMTLSETSRRESDVAASSSSAAGPQLLSPSSTTPSNSASAASAALPRPKSTELPQSLHSYLSTVFDVDWSVGLPNTEDSLFIQATAASSSGATNASINGSPLPASAGKRKSVGLSSGLSNVSSAFATSTSTPPSSSSAHSTHSRSSTVSTTSSISSVSSVSSASSVSSTETNHSKVGPGQSRLKKQEEPSKDSIGITGAGNASANLARKSSLPSAQPRGNAHGITTSHSTSTVGDSVNGGNINGNTNPTTRSDNIANNNLPARKASINGHVKPMMVPGRRSSLLQTGQMPPVISTPKGGSQPNGSNLGRHNTTGRTATALDGSRSPQLSPVSPSLSPVSPSLTPISPTPSPTSPSLSPIKSPSLSPTSASSTSPKPAFAKRTSSLPSERPPPIQRSRSSDNTSRAPVAITTSVSQTSIIGLPRPLLSPTLPATSLSSSPPPSPPSQHQPQYQQHLTPGPYPYARSTSDDQLTTRNSVHGGQNRKSPAPSPTLSPPTYTSETQTSIASPARAASTLSRPSPSYMLKASRSTPCLVSGAEERHQQDGREQPAMPDLYRQQQEHYAQQGLFYSQGQSAPPQQPQITSNGFKLLARTSSRRTASSSSGAPGGMNISTPLPLVPSNQSSGSEYGSGGYDHGDAHAKSNNGSYGIYGSGGHAYARSMSNVSIMSSSSAVTTNSARTSRTQVEKTKAGSSSVGRWNSMKMILGLRVGQGAKG
ncbi:hypothetical protein BGZ75_007453 [Mortierella antarctica]|nr:hypothetical protein BGZ75_007453 [Mortierella antarctica]